MTANGVSECPSPAPRHNLDQKTRPKPRRAMRDLLREHLLEEALPAVADHYPLPSSLLPGQISGPTSAKGSSPADFIEMCP